MIVVISAVIDVYQSVACDISWQYRAAVACLHKLLPVAGHCRLHTIVREVGPNSDTIAHITLAW